MTRVKTRLVSLAAAGISVALVAACSSSGGTGGGKSQVAKAPTKKTDNAVNQIAATPRSGIKTGGKLTWGLSQAIPNFNYYNVNGTLDDTNNVQNAILPNPFHFDAAGTPTVDTDYFTSIKKTSDSPQTIEYKINPKAKWSNGRPLSYEDFAGLWKSTNGKNSAFQISSSIGYDQIASVTKGTGDQDVIVKYSKPFTDWQSLFTPLEPKELTATPKMFNSGWVDHPTVTSGPFKWGSQNKTAKTYTLVKDPGWWGQPAELDQLIFAVYNDPSAGVQALGSHELDYYDISGGDAVGNVQAVKGYSGVAIREAAGNNYRQFTFNTKDPLLSDIKVRQAIVLGIDRQQITTALIGKLGGNPTPLQNHFFMKNQSAYTETCGQYCKYDPAKAKSILESDGWKMTNGVMTKNGKQLVVTITIPSQTPNAKSESELAQASLAKAGIKLKLQPVPSDDFFDKYVYSGDQASSSKFQLTTFTWIGTPFPVGGALSIFKYDPKAKGQNAGFGGNAAINNLLTKAYTSPTTAQENALANTASKAMWDNAAWLPLYQRPQVAAVNANVVNLGARGFADIVYQNIGFKK